MPIKSRNGNERAVKVTGSSSTKSEHESVEHTERPCRSDAMVSVDGCAGRRAERRWCDIWTEMDAWLPNAQRRKA